jgi:uncharacterized lipoprotein YmbA
MKKTGIICLLSVLLLVGCKTPQQTVYVPLPVTDSSSESHHDSKAERDSVIKEKTVIVQVADSGLLAQLEAMGVQVDESKQYIMVLQKELERKISELSSNKSDTAIKYKEVPVPYPVEVPVEKELTKWQKIQMKGFWWLSVGLIGYVLFRTRKVWLKWLKRV